MLQLFAGLIISASVHAHNSEQLPVALAKSKIVETTVQDVQSITASERSNEEILALRTSGHLDFIDSRGKETRLATIGRPAGIPRFIQVDRGYAVLDNNALMLVSAKGAVKKHVLRNLYEFAGPGESTAVEGDSIWYINENMQIEKLGGAVSKQKFDGIALVGKTELFAISDGNLVSLNKQTLKRTKILRSKVHGMHSVAKGVALIQIEIPTGYQAVLLTASGNLSKGLFEIPKSDWVWDASLSGENLSFILYGGTKYFNKAETKTEVYSRVTGKITVISRRPAMKVQRIKSGFAFLEKGKLSFE
ncbi:MAG: hypothetical protein K8R88_07240 [Armatimonadetes bacterium]|nr:hypothetical protein [Armatimonadota bacterium]